MLGILITLFAIVIIGAAVLILITLVTADFIGARTYQKAERCNGVIIENMDNLTTFAYGGSTTYTPKRKYKQFKVEFLVNGEVHNGVTCTKKKEYKVGDSIEVRYERNKKSGEIEVVTQECRDRFRELVIAIIIAVIISIFCIYGKSKGFIN